MPPAKRASRASATARNDSYVDPPPPLEEVRAEMEAYQPSYMRLSAAGRAAFDAYDGPVNCGPPGRMCFD